MNGHSDSPEQCLCLCSAQVSHGVSPSLSLEHVSWKRWWNKLLRPTNVDHGVEIERSVCNRYTQYSAEHFAHSMSHWVIVILNTVRFIPVSGERRAGGAEVRSFTIAQLVLS